MTLETSVREADEMDTGPAGPMGPAIAPNIEPPRPSVAPSIHVETAVETDGAGQLEVRGLNCYYGAFRAVRDVSFPMPPRSVTAIIGPSGCGKSTFLRTLNRMHELTPGARVDGSVTLDGVDIYGGDVDPVQLRRVVGMVFQRPNPFPTMSIYDNVAAGLRLTGRLRRGDLDSIVERSLRRSAL